MLQIDNTIISFDIFEEKFVCDLASCKGICCVEGDSGAPLEEDEIPKIKEILPIIWTDLSEKYRKIIEKQGIYYVDEDGDTVTSIVDGLECVFTYFDENGICKCAIEKAYQEGKTDFQKPISCHLYPVRLLKLNDLIAINVHQWHVCDCARKLGEKMNVPVYKFLKEPLIRQFGEYWYSQFEIAAE
jgi:hypothetical protein